MSESSDRAPQTPPDRGTLTSGQREAWERDGFLIFPGLFTAAEMDAVNDLIDELWRTRARPENPLVLDVYAETERSRRIPFRDATEDMRWEPYKLNDLYLEHDLIRQVALAPGLRCPLRALLDGDPIIINSLNFEKGSQQTLHVDTLFMPPPVENRMVAAWIALEDCDPDAGPLVYVPGSHRIPPHRFSDGRLNLIPTEASDFFEHIEAEVKRLNLKTETFTPGQGDVLVWHAQLLHGGEPIRDRALTRRSLVVHHFRATDCRDHGDPARVRECGRGQFHLRRAHQPVEPDAEP
jgi:hypothetical protein